jgi:WD40 repeat protein
VDPKVSIYSAYIVPSANLLITGDNQSNITLYDATTGAVKAILKSSNVIAEIAVAPDETAFASCSLDKEIRIWSLPDGTRGRVLQARKADTKLIMSVCYSPNGRVLFSASGDGELKRWDVESGKLIWEKAVESVQRIRISPDGKQLALALTGGDLLLYDAGTGALIKTLKGHNAPGRGVAYSPTSRVLASCSYDGTVRLWDRYSGVMLTTFGGFSNFVDYVTFSADGNTLFACGEDGQIQIWRAATEDDLRARFE